MYKKYRLCDLKHYLVFDYSTFLFVYILFNRGGNPLNVSSLELNKNSLYRSVHRRVNYLLRTPVIWMDNRLGGNTFVSVWTSVEQRNQSLKKYHSTSLYNAAITSYLFGIIFCTLLHMAVSDGFDENRLDKNDFIISTRIQKIYVLTEWFDECVALFINDYYLAYGVCCSKYTNYDFKLNTLDVKRKKGMD